MSFRNREKSETLASFGVILCPVSQRVQIKFIFTDNVHILFLSSNVKKSKQLQKFYWKGETSLVVPYHACVYSVTVSYCSLYMYQKPEKHLLGPWLKNLFDPLNSTKNHQLQDKWLYK